MSHRPESVLIYHITDVVNLPGILAEGGLHSDVAMARRNPAVIGHRHIKERRMSEISVPCCGDRFVGEFVPFYFCPRSPMLYSINNGRTGLKPGSQRTILHLVSSVGAALSLERPWAISDGNAGAFHTSFFADVRALTGLDWSAIRATDWAGRTNPKAAEFLVADFFPWTKVSAVGCHNEEVQRNVQKLLESQRHQPAVTVESDWYY
jgi:hypothetical protein